MKPINFDELWTAVRSVEDASRQGTALLQSLSSLLIRQDPLSKAWLEERRKIRTAIVAHLAHAQPSTAPLNLSPASSPPESEERAAPVS